MRDWGVVRLQQMLRTPCLAISAPVSDDTPEFEEFQSVISHPLLVLLRIKAMMCKGKLLGIPSRGSTCSCTHAYSRLVRFELWNSPVSI